MNYADMIGGTWYPKGGMYSIVNGMYQLAVECGVHFHFDEEAKRISVEDGIATTVFTEGDNNRADDAVMVQPVEREYHADVIVGAADYHFIESVLLPEKSKSYSERYWNSRTMAPSCLLYYVGLR